MKKFIQYITALISILILTSCQFTEKIHIDENGSGTYTLRIEMSDMMAAIKNMDTPVETEGEEREQEVIDTILNFRDILEEKKDSIEKLSQEEQEKIVALEGLKIRIAVNEAENTAFTDFIFDFNSVKELENIQEKITKAQSIKESKGPQTHQPTNMQYSFNGKTFKRKVIKNELSQKEKEAYEKSLQESASFLDGSSYKIEYRFPRPIKSTSFKGATFSEDRKTIFIEIELNKIMENPELLDFEVVLE